MILIVYAAHLPPLHFPLLLLQQLLALYPSLPPIFLMRILSSPPFPLSPHFVILKSLISEIGGDTYKNPRPMILTVVDLGGLCVMTIPSRWLDLDHPVITKIELRDYTRAVLGMTLLVVRTEYIHDVRR